MLSMEHAHGIVSPRLLQAPLRLRHYENETDCECACHSAAANTFLLVEVERLSPFVSRGLTAAALLPVGPAKHWIGGAELPPGSFLKTRMTRDCEAQRCLL
jgi:hypothetical protein